MLLEYTKLIISQKIARFFKYLQIFENFFAFICLFLYMWVVHVWGRTCIHICIWCGGQTSSVISKELSILFSKTKSYCSGALRRLLWLSSEPWETPASAHSSRG